jgi:membrane protease YdiL (CAAX protease family)
VENLTTTAPPARRVSWAAIAIGAALTLALLVGLALLGQLGAFLLVGLEVLPFVGLGILAALGERRTWARWLAYAYLVALGLAILGASGLLLFGALAAESGLLRSGAAGGASAALGALLQSGLTFMVSGGLLLLVTLLPLLPGARRWIARWLPIDPDSTTHVVGLSAALMIATLPLLTLLLLGGRPPLLTMLAALGDQADALGGSPLEQQLSLIYTLVWMLPGSLVLVGFPLRRGIGAALSRLGLVWPSGRQVALGLAAAVGLVLLAIPLDALISWLWGITGWPHTETGLFEQLMGGLISPVGALVVGVSAGLGEELAVRGVLQPRLGILLSNLAFTAAHAYQYGFDGLLSVFVIGLALGLLRRHTNTTTSALAHGGYDFILILASALGFG